MALSPQTHRDAAKGAPLLCDQPVAIGTRCAVRYRQLVTNAGRLDGTVPRRGPEHHVPPRKQHAEVTAIARAFMTVADRVMTPMKNRTHDSAFEQPSIWQARVHVLHALHEVADRDQHDELRRLHADEQRNRGEERGL